jgi:hypothetical protein
MENIMSFKKTLLTTALLAATATANAAVINGNGLQNGLNSVTQGGTFSQNVNDENQQHSGDEVWTLDAVSSANAVMMFEFAGFANSNTLGIYDLNSNSTLELFSGAASTGFSTKLQISGSNLIATYFDGIGMFTGQQVANFGGDTQFGFYLSTPQNNTFYSQADRNGDHNNDGIADDHMVAFRGDGTDKMDPDQDGNYGTFTSNNFILAWEDLRLDVADRDYADMVVMVESFVPVSEPGTLALLGLGLTGLGFARRKQAKA